MDGEDWSDVCGKADPGPQHRAPLTSSPHPWSWPDRHSKSSQDSWHFIMSRLICSHELSVHCVE